MRNYHLRAAQMAVGGLPFVPRLPAIATEPIAKPAASQPQRGIDLRRHA
jgi:hypothetical protein